MTPTATKLLDLAKRLIREVDEKELEFVLWSLEITAKRSLEQAELRRLRTQVSGTRRQSHTVKPGGNVVAFKGNDPAA